MNTRECRFCGATMFYSPAGGWSADHAPHCAIRRSKEGHRPGPPSADNTFDPEQIIGPVGAPTWAVTYSLHRIGAADQGIDYTETVHVRAVEYDGAILLARELVPERIIDVEAYQITTTKGEA